MPTSYRTNCAPLSCCSPACSMNTSGGCTPALSPSSAVGVATPVSPGYSVSTPAPSPAVTSNCLPRTSSTTGHAVPAADARAWKKTPEVISAIEAASQHDVVGDPIAGVRWTRRTTEKIATEFATLHNFKNHGTTWERSPQAVNDHDFRSQADGIAIPYGIYDVAANRGFAVVGTSHDTLDFAADSLVRWWQRDGSQRYPNASRLLVLADSGGSNAPRVHSFKYALQTRLVDPFQLTVPLCHYPSGASKWNPIDHRLYSEISKNWAGHPLRRYRTILNHIRTTTTDSGLSVTAQLVNQDYPRGVKIPDAQFASIALEPHQILRSNRYATTRSALGPDRNQIPAFVFALALSSPVVSDPRHLFPGPPYRFTSCA